MSFKEEQKALLERLVEAKEEERVLLPSELAYVVQVAEAEETLLATEIAFEQKSKELEG